MTEGGEAEQEAEAGRYLWFPDRQGSMEKSYVKKTSKQKGGHAPYVEGLHEYHRHRRSMLA